MEIAIAVAASIERKIMRRTPSLDNVQPGDIGRKAYCGGEYVRLC